SLTYSIGTGSKFKERFKHLAYKYSYAACLKAYRVQIIVCLLIYLGFYGGSVSSCCSKKALMNRAFIFNYLKHHIHLAKFEQLLRERSFWIQQFLQFHLPELLRNYLLLVLSLNL